MAVITFCSNEIKETGQTLSMAAIASYMAIEHNYKILMISTGFNDLTLENCFWEYNKIRSTGGVLKQDVGTIGLVSGVEGCYGQGDRSNRLPGGVPHFGNKGRPFLYQWGTDIGERC